jgi:5-deoxy-glucuronate isomerase
LSFLEFGVLHLTPAHTAATLAFPGREAVVLLLEGAAAVRGGGQSWEVGPRRSVFDDKPWAVYVPPGVSLDVRARDSMLSAVATAPAQDHKRIQMIGPDRVTDRAVGANNWKRRVQTVVDQHVSERLLVGETLNPPGHWSSYPPHKHDRLTEGGELPMEEVYYYTLRPAGGFGLQLIYSAPGESEPLDQVYRVVSGDVVMLPRGYHPVVAAAGYELHYVWAIAGPQVLPGAWSDDPAHAWIRKLEREA